MNLKCDVCKAKFKVMKRPYFTYDYDANGREVVFCTNNCKKKLSNMHKMTPIQEALVP